jgi:DNA polymerase III gamma/tau subunit
MCKIQVKNFLILFIYLTYRFSPLTTDTQLERLELICKKENLEIKKDILEYLISISEGDLRKSVNLLQTISTFDKSMISTNLINDICGVIPVDLISDLFEVAKFNKPEIIIKKADEFLCYGYDLKQFNYQFTDFIASNRTINDDEKGKINFLILDCELNLHESSSQNIQLYNLLTGIRSLFKMNY